MEGEVIDELEEALALVGEEKDTVLHLNFQGLDRFPPQIIDNPAYHHVHRIYMKSNKLLSLPTNIGILKNLVELYLVNNRLSELPASVADLEQLESLDLSGNLLVTLPPVIGRLEALENLSVANNKLKCIPKEIGLLQKLQVLNAMSNDLPCLPSSLGVCAGLRRLLVDRNNLRWLPDHLCNLPALEELSATGNQLLCLPIDLGDIESLKRVYVDNNPYLHAIPLSIHSQELGFNSCGTCNLPQSVHHSGQYLSVTVEQEDTYCGKVIHMPRQLLTALARDTPTVVVSLLELALRAVYAVYKQDLPIRSLPVSLSTILCCPTARCHVCRRPVFTQAYPMVFEGQIRVYSLYKLGLCCSRGCVQLASLIVHLPLIYPNSTMLHNALALI